MSQLKKLVATVAASVALVPALGIASASATTVDPNLALFNTAVDMSSLEALVLIPGGCTLTYVGNVERTPVGVPTVTLPAGGVTVTYSPTTKYAVAIENLTVGYISCI
jgi:hypothetical protein